MVLRRYSIALAIIAIVAASCVAESPSVTASPIPCVVEDSTGSQAWFDAPTSEATAFGQAIQDLVATRPDTAAGAVFCSHYEGVAAFLPTYDMSLKPQLEAIAANYPDMALNVVGVPNALTPLRKLQQAINAVPLLRNALNGIAPDVYNGGLQLGIDPGSWSLRPTLESQVISLAASLLGRRVTVTSVEQPVANAAGTRFADSAPYKMGGAIDSAEDGCTTGMPIVVNGVHGVLTAGHCLGTTFYNNDHTVGVEYTTAYLANTDIYGDWKIIRGDFGAFVFNGPYSSSSTLSIDGANWNSQLPGSQLCTSGRNSYQTCRYFILQNNVSVNVVNQRNGDRFTVNPTIIMRHDSTLGGGSDANGFGLGDSGGPCYSADGIGGVSVAGIVTGAGTVQGSQRYWCTMLSGVHNWNSGAVLGGW